MKQTKQLGMSAIALTDEMNLFGAIKFYQAALQHGIKPIIGAELCYVESLHASTVYKMTVLCKNLHGYRQLTALISRAYLELQKSESPRLLKAWLVGQLSHMIVLLGMESDLASDLTTTATLAPQRLQWWQNQAQICLAVQRTEHPQQELFFQACLVAAEKAQIPVVATNAVRFLTGDDYEAHEVRVCIHQGELLDSRTRKRSYTAEQYLKSPHQMEALFAAHPTLLTNTEQIAKQCNVILPLGKTALPNFSAPAGQSIDSYLEAQVQAGLAERLAKQPYDLGAYQKRITHELSVISRMGFAGYFLIVADFIRWAKTQDIPVGPGRGSGAGSLVAYALGITDLDPLHYELLFERFLNPERISMPDFDIDFCIQGRDRVIQYVIERYGADNVAQIITFGTMAAKAVIRDVGRVLGMPYGFVDRVAKLIPMTLGITLELAMQQAPELSELYAQDEEVKILMDMSRKLEGLSRNAGRHAGGVVIAPKPLTDYTAIYMDEEGSFPVTQFDKDDIEAIGLIKFDFLGLKTLTIIKQTVDLIYHHFNDAKADPIHMLNISLADKKTYALLQAGQTTAIFQLESYGIKKLLPRLKPDCFEDVMALVALYRPGPLQSGMVDDFISRKHGQSPVHYLHPHLESILSSTYGVILYQEQVLQIAQSLGGYSLGKADLLRRAMGKKKAGEMAKHRSMFVAGALESGMTKADAEYVFDLMEKFAGYGFNKSHSAAYALLSYQTAWLKAHYPAAFMAAVLSLDMDHTEKIVSLITDCKNLGITVLPPDIAIGEYNFKVLDETRIAFGLGAIKGVGKAAIDSIVATRQQQKFDSFESFCMHLDPKKCNRRTLEALIQSGALDGWGYNRATMLAHVTAGLKAAEQYATNQQHGQADLFALVAKDSSLAIAFTCEPCPELSLLEQLRLEKQVLGYYVFDHPVNYYKTEFMSSSIQPIAKVWQMDKSKSSQIAGIIENMKRIITRRNETLILATVSDATGSIEVAISKELFQANRSLLNRDTLIIIQGRIQEEAHRQRFRATEFCSIERFRVEQEACLWIDMGSFDQTTDLKLPSLMAALKQAERGGCPVVLKAQVKEVTGAIGLGRKWHVNPTDALIEQLQKLVGEQQVQLSYQLNPTTIL